MLYVKPFLYCKGEMNSSVESHSPWTQMEWQVGNWGELELSCGQSSGMKENSITR